MKRMNRPEEKENSGLQFFYRRQQWENPGQGSGERIQLSQRLPLPMTVELLDRYCAGQWWVDMRYPCVGSAANCCLARFAAKTICKNFLQRLFRIHSADVGDHRIFGSKDLVLIDKQLRMFYNTIIF